MKLMDHEWRAVQRYKRMKQLGRVTWLLWVSGGVALLLALLIAFALGRLTALWN